MIPVSATATVTNHQTKILVIGDLNVDVVFEGVAQGQFNSLPALLQTGGTGFNAALAFQEVGFEPLLFGKVGRDEHGRWIRRSLVASGLPSQFVTESDRATGACYILYSACDEVRTIVCPPNNANDYDVEHLRATLASAKLTSRDYIFLATYLFPQCNYDLTRSSAFLAELFRSPARLIVDLVPHNLYQAIDRTFLDNCLAKPAHMLIAERETLSRLLVPRGHGPATQVTDSIIASGFQFDHFVVREGLGDISEQSVFTRVDGQVRHLERKKNTGYATIQPSDRRAFCDRLTAELLRSMVERGACT